MVELGKYVIMTPFIEVTYTIASKSFKAPSAFMSGSQLVSSTKWRHTDTRRGSEAEGIKLFLRVSEEDSRWEQELHHSRLPVVPPSR